MLWYLQVICFLKRDNKYKERRIDGKIDTKQGKQLLIQLEVDMATDEAFERENITYLRDQGEDSSSGVSSTLLEDDKSDESDIIEEEEEEEEEKKEEEEEKEEEKTPRSRKRPAWYQTPEPPTPELFTPQSRRPSSFHITDKKYQNFVTSSIQNHLTDFTPIQHKILHK